MLYYFLEMLTRAESILRDKSKEFAKQIVFLCRDIKANMTESVLTNQLLRSGTSIGANIHEAQYAQGTKERRKRNLLCFQKNEKSSKKVLTNRTLYAILLPVPSRKILSRAIRILRHRQAVRQRTLTPSLPRFES